MKILLDFDDTIFDYSKTMEIIFNKINRKYFRYKGSLFSIYNNIYLNDRIMGLEAKTIRKFEIICDSLHYFGDSKEIYSYYVTLRKSTSFFKQGTLTFLSEISRENEVYLFSNGFSIVQKALLEKNDFLEYFNKIYTSDIVGFYKPSPLYLEFIMKDIGDDDVGSYCVVGNSLVEDLPYYKYGLKCIIVSSQNETVSNNFLCADGLTKVTQIIKELNGGR